MPEQTCSCQFHTDLNLFVMCHDHWARFQAATTDNGDDFVDALITTFAPHQETP